MKLQQQIAKDFSAKAEEIGVTPYAVARDTNLSINSVYAVLKGTGNPNFSTVQAVYDYLESKEKEQC